jgi:Na+/melibiose symporter-like transporter
MAGVMFALVLHFQYAWGWTPLMAGLANLPIILTMICATPLTEWLVRRLGHRIACFVGAVVLAAGLGLMAWSVEQNYVAIALSMVVMTIGLRTVMTICAVALVGAMPENRTSMGAAMNDAAQEVGTSIGTAVVGTLIAVLVTTVLPDGVWSHELVASFFHGEQAIFGIIAVAVGLIAGFGALTLSNSHTVDEHAPAEAETHV